ncbi:hypothetical protein SAMN05660420_02442 [Desulfuromusa kysingii]|uniref:Uncharacterized protein n=1 Tax=Desulfuromusa kysingii TaxID=37625 RepID=A0A1H4C5L3_9BACT|nr:hypothetical protein SAMN05660420_02442 [Desulfuromusa kysingii]
MTDPLIIHNLAGSFLYAAALRSDKNLGCQPHTFPVLDLKSCRKALPVENIANILRDSQPVPTRRVETS